MSYVEVEIEKARELATETEKLVLAIREKDVKKFFEEAVLRINNGLIHKLFKRSDVTYEQVAESYNRHLHFEHDYVLYLLKTRHGRQLQVAQNLLKALEKAVPGTTVKISIDDMYWLVR